MRGVTVVCVVFLGCLGLVIAQIPAPPAAPPPPPVSAQVLPVEKMRQHIEADVDYIISQQDADGGWHFRFDNRDYDVGCTALCTLALRHSGLTKAIVPAQRGLAFVAQHAPEPKTYSAGMVATLLYEAGDKQYQRLINPYALMVIHSQADTGAAKGIWTYQLNVPNANGRWPERPLGGDQSNMQFGVLAMYFSQQMGFQVPMETWLRIKEFYETNQNPDGGWGYGLRAVTPAELVQGASRSTMTPAGTIGLSLADEILQTQSGPHACKMLPENPVVQKGLDWIASHPGGGSYPYMWYAMERLGILSGRSEFGGKDWVESGSKALLASGHNYGGLGGKLPNTALAVLFMSRALEPIMFNKLKRTGDWNNDPYDMKHLCEHITLKYQNPRQWRIVTLDSPVDYLLRVPILYINGHDPLKFTDEEKAKLKEYVDKGGMIFAMSCCGSGKFDKSFRDLCVGLWPENPLAQIPRDHPLFQYPKRNLTPPILYGVTLGGEGGRLGVVYSHSDLCCAWHTGGRTAEPAYIPGVNLVFYMDVVASRLGAVKAGYGVVHTGSETPAEAKKPQGAAVP